MANELPIPTCAQCRMIGKAVPDSFLQMEADIGAPVMLAFLHARAGWTFKIPQRHPDRTDHPEAVAWLKEHVGTGTVEIPLGPLRHSTRLTWAIYLGVKAGKSLSEIARETGCTLRTVSATKTRLKKHGLSLAPNPQTTEQETPR